MFEGRYHLDQKDSKCYNLNISLLTDFVCICYNKFDDMRDQINLTCHLYNENLKLQLVFKTCQVNMNIIKNSNNGPLDE